MLSRLLELDVRYSRQLSVAERPGALRTLAAVFAHSGDSWFWLLGLGLLYWRGTEFWKARALALGAGILITAAIVLTIKFLVKRRRPEGTWGAIYRSTDPHSFPSGHAARAMLLVVLGLSLGPAWLATLLVVWAPLVILARVAMGVHFLSDVLAGAVFGGAIGLVLARLLPTLIPGM